MDKYLPYIATVICAIVSGLASYMASRKQAKSDLQKLMKQHELDIKKEREKFTMEKEKMEIEHKHQLELKQKEMEKEIDEYRELNGRDKFFDDNDSDGSNYTVDDETGEINMNKKLYRSTSNKMIAGVCSGLAEYINIDPTIVRLIWALIALSGAGVLAYLVAAIIIPEKPSDIIDV